MMIGSLQHLHREGKDPSSIFYGKACGFGPIHRARKQHAASGRKFTGSNTSGGSAKEGEADRSSWDAC